MIIEGKTNRIGWSVEDIRQLKELLADGKSVRECADILCRNASAVRSFMQGRNIQVSDIRGWSVEKILVLKSLLAEGKSVRECADFFCRNENTVRAIMHKRDIPLPTVRLEAPLCKTEKQNRDCLRCHKNFMSNGTENRICPACKTRNERNVGENMNGCYITKRNAGQMPSKQKPVIEICRPDQADGWSPLQPDQVMDWVYRIKSGGEVLITGASNGTKKDLLAKLKKSIQRITVLSSGAISEEYGYSNKGNSKLFGEKLAKPLCAK